ncbi:MAG: hypothetical protein U9R79_14080 [Armatimonadota bacterium]|nr:hypothetical protein [Armatimonadota bacterium]
MQAKWWWEPVLHRIAALVIVAGGIMVATAWAAAADAEERAQVPTIQTTCVDDDATGYATFQSHNQKVVSNRRGIFMTYIRRRNDPYTAQQWRLLWSRDGGRSFQTLHEDTHATNPAVLETDAEDTIYLVRPDFADGNSYLYRFLAADDYAEPRISTIPGSSHGKFAMALDPGRRQLYYFSANNTFHAIGLDGEVRSSVRLLQPGPNAVLQYPLLDMSPDGTLFAAWTTQKHGVYLYWDIHVMKSQDGGASWQRLNGRPLEPPIVADDSGPADRITLDDEFECHTWLSSFIAKEGKLHFLYEAQTPEPREHYVRYDLQSGERELDVYPRFGGETLGICRLDGFFATDADRAGGPLYCVGTALSASRRLACVVSYDNGDTWRDYALSAREFGNLYAIGGCRTVTADGFVIGSCTDTPAGGSVRTGVSVHFLKVPTAASSPSE